MNPINRCLDCIAQPKLYSIEQSIALVFGLICLGVDIWAVVCTVRYFKGDNLTRAGASHTFGVVSLCLEPLLAISVFLLLAFAFSTTPLQKQEA